MRLRFRPVVRRPTERRTTPPPPPDEPPPIPNTMRLPVGFKTAPAALTVGFAPPVAGITTAVGFSADSPLVALALSLGVVPPPPADPYALLPANYAVHLPASAGGVSAAWRTNGGVTLTAGADGSTAQALRIWCRTAPPPGDVLFTFLATVLDGNPPFDDDGIFCTFTERLLGTATGVPPSPADWAPAEYQDEAGAIDVGDPIYRKKGKGYRNSFAGQVPDGAGITNSANCYTYEGNTTSPFREILPTTTRAAGDFLMARNVRYRLTYRRVGTTVTATRTRLSDGQALSKTWTDAALGPSGLGVLGYMGWAAFRGRSVLIEQEPGVPLVQTITGEPPPPPPPLDDFAVVPDYTVNYSTFLGDGASITQQADAIRMKGRVTNGNEALAADTAATIIDRIPYAAPAKVRFGFTRRFKAAVTTAQGSSYFVGYVTAVGGGNPANIPAGTSTYDNDFAASVRGFRISWATFNSQSGADGRVGFQLYTAAGRVQLQPDVAVDMQLPLNVRHEMEFELNGTGKAWLRDLTSGVTAVFTDSRLTFTTGHLMLHTEYDSEASFDTVRLVGVVVEPPPPPPPTGDQFDRPNLQGKVAIPVTSLAAWSSAKTALRGSTATRYILLQTQLSGDQVFDVPGTADNPAICMADAPNGVADFSGRGGFSAGTLRMTAPWGHVHQLAFRNRTSGNALVNILADNCIVTRCLLDGGTGVSARSDANAPQGARIGFNLFDGLPPDTSGDSVAQIHVAFMKSTATQVNGWHIYRNCFIGTGGGTGVIYFSPGFPPPPDFINSPDTLIEENFIDSTRHFGIYLKHAAKIVRNHVARIEQQTIMFRGNNARGGQMIENRVDSPIGNSMRLQGPDHILRGNVCSKGFSLFASSDGGGPKITRGADNALCQRNQGPMRFGEFSSGDPNFLKALSGFRVEAHQGSFSYETGGAVTYNGTTGIISSNNARVDEPSCRIFDASAVTVRAPPVLSATVTGPRGVGKMWGT